MTDLCHYDFTGSSYVRASAKPWMFVLSLALHAQLIPVQTNLLTAKSFIPNKLRLLFPDWYLSACCVGDAAFLDMVLL